MENKSLVLTEIEDQVSGLRAENKSETAARTAIVIAGMHRSGTSALTGVLSLLGCDTNDDLIPADDHNKKGYWESKEISDLNEKMLESAGLSWNSWEPLPKSWFNSGRASKFRKQALDILERNFFESGLFVLKDPRICRLLPLWSDALKVFGAETIVIMPVRDPREVAVSLLHRNGMNTSTSQLIWLRYVLDAEMNSRDFRRCVVRYDDLVTDWRSVVDKISRDLGQIAWPCTSVSAQAKIASFIDGSLKHNNTKSIDTVTAQIYSLWIHSTYATLLELQSQGSSIDANESLDAINNCFSEAALNLGQPFYEHQQHGAYLHNKLKQLETEIDVIRDLHQRAQTLAEHKDVQLAQIKDELRQSELLASEQSHQLNHFRRVSANLETELAERDVQINNLSQAIASTSSQLEESRLLVEASEEIVSQRDFQISELQRQMAIYESSASDLERQLKACVENSSINYKLYSETAKSLSMRNVEYRCIASRLDAVEDILIAKREELRLVGLMSQADPASSTP
ncbi:sulfotransferase family protein [Methylorubrum aminovorans]